MGWSIGYSNGRDIGYGVPAECDLPTCNKEINRGLSYCCGGYFSDAGCGLYFCEEHMTYRKPHGEDEIINLCPRCYRYRPPYKPKPDIKEWLGWKLTDDSWAEWRKENKEKVKEMKAMVGHRE